MVGTQVADSDDEPSPRRLFAELANQRRALQRTASELAGAINSSPRGPPLGAQTSGPPRAATGR